MLTNFHLPLLEALLCVAERKEKRALFFFIIWLRPPIPSVWNPSGCLVDHCSDIIHGLVALPWLLLFLYCVCSALLFLNYCLITLQYDVRHVFLSLRPVLDAVHFVIPWYRSSFFSLWKLYNGFLFSFIVRHIFCPASRDKFFNFAKYMFSFSSIWTPVKFD